MKIDVINVNESLRGIVSDKSKKVFLDANIFIPPDRTKLGAPKPIYFDFYRVTILNPIFNYWDNLSIHKAVDDELVGEKVRAFADEMINSDPSKLLVHDNNELSDKETVKYNTNLDAIAQHSKYQPDIDNSDDRGEVVSLAFMSAKDYLLFSSNDNLPIRLIKEAEALETGLDNMRIIQMYEIIYVLYKLGISNAKDLRILYKYLYYATSRDKRDNPSWDDYIKGMDELYSDIWEV